MSPDLPRQRLLMALPGATSRLPSQGMRDAELRALGRETFFLSLGMLILLVAIGAASVVFTLWLLVLLPLWLVGTVHVGKYLDRKYGVGAYPED